MLSYCLVLFVITSLGLLALREYLLKKRPSLAQIKLTQDKIQQYLLLQDWKEAEKYLLPLVKNNWGYPLTGILEVRFLRLTKQYPLGKKRALSTLQRFPQERAIQRELAQILLQLKEGAAALEALHQCQPLPSKEEDILDFAAAYLHMGQHAKAMQLIENHFKNTHDPRVLLLAGECAFQAHAYQQALTFYQQVPFSHPTSPSLPVRKGHCFLQLGEIEKAKEQFCKEEKSLEAHLGLGACYEAQGRYPEALEIYQKDGIWKQGDARIYRQAGICSLYVKQYRFAELYLKKSLSQAGPTARTLAFLGVCLEKQYRWKEAERVYLDLAHRFPHHIAGHRALAWLYGVGLSTTLSAKQGLAGARKAVEILPDAISLEVLSACEARAGNFDEAHAIQESLCYDKTDRSSRTRRCRAMRTLRQKRPLSEEQVCRVLVA